MLSLTGTSKEKGSKEKGKASQECEDKYYQCGLWAANGDCDKPAYLEQMAADCPHACGFCPGTAGTVSAQLI